MAVGRNGGFKGRHFASEVILWALRWYLAFPTSYRDLSSDTSACPLHVLPTPLSWSTQDTAGEPFLPAPRWRHRKSCLVESTTGAVALGSEE
jgi:hypothetical protein